MKAEQQNQARHLIFQGKTLAQAAEAVGVSKSTAERWSRQGDWVEQRSMSEAESLTLQEEFPKAVLISTRDKNDLALLREKIMAYFESDMSDEDIFVPYSVQGIIGDIRAKMRALSESYDANGVTLNVRCSADSLGQLKKKLLIKSDF